MDFGWTYAFAAVELAWERDQHIVYVIKAHRLREATRSACWRYSVHGAPSCPGPGRAMEGAKHLKGRV
jgi:hypothetical protein